MYTRHQLSSVFVHRARVLRIHQYIYGPKTHNSYCDFPTIIYIYINCFVCVIRVRQHVMEAKTRFFCVAFYIFTVRNAALVHFCASFQQLNTKIKGVYACAMRVDCGAFAFLVRSRS